MFFFFCFLFMAAKLGKLKTELREAEDNLVKALAGISVSQNHIFFSSVI